MAHITLTGLTKRFGSVTAVNNVSLNIADGEFFTLLGPSGCGKTTTLRMIAGLELPDEGRIEVAGRDVTYVPANRRRFGMVFQNYALFPHMTVFENVAFGLRTMREANHEITRKVEEALELVRLAGYGARKPSQLSGGQQQRVALARALAARPTIMLLDEPLSNLDAQLREETRAEIQRLQKDSGITTIYVTHDQDEALALSDRIAVMNNGRLEQLGAPADIYGSPASAFVARFIGQMNVLSGSIIAVDNGQALVDVGFSQLSVTLHPTANSTSQVSLEDETTGRPLDVRVGQSVKVGIHPENLEPGSPDAGNLISARVDLVQFNGVTTRLSLTAGEGSLHALLLSRSLTAALERGRDIQLNVSPDDVLLLDDAP